MSAIPKKTVERLIEAVGKSTKKPKVSKPSTIGQSSTTIESTPKEEEWEKRRLEQEQAKMLS